MNSKPYKWKNRQKLVKLLQDSAEERQQIYTSDSLEERLTDLSRSCSHLYLEAKNAIEHTSDSQWKNLLRDANKLFLIWTNSW